jgi:hypothetical protein
MAMHNLFIHPKAHRLSLTLLVALTMLLTKPSFAQDTIGIDAANSFIVSGAPFSSQVIFSLSVSNSSPTLQYMDSVIFEGYVDTGAVVLPTPVEIARGPISINPSSFATFLPFQVFVTDTGASNLRFRIGGNVIVVWPKSVNTLFVTGDSLFHPITIFDSVNGINDVNRDPLQLTCFPNPAQNWLYIQSRLSVKIQTVVVRDTQGRELERIPYSGAPLNTSTWENGVYILEFQFENGLQLYRNIMH